MLNQTCGISAITETIGSVTRQQGKNLHSASLYVFSSSYPLPTGAGPPQPHRSLFVMVSVGTPALSLTRGTGLIQPGGGGGGGWAEEGSRTNFARPPAILPSGRQRTAAALVRDVTAKAPCLNSVREAPLSVCQSA